MRKVMPVILSMALAAALIVGCAPAAVEAGCTSVALSESRVREIAIEEFRRRGGRFVEGYWETRVTRESCVNRFFAQSRPAAPGAHFGVTIDDAGNVIQYSPGV
jgi:hypothetical protein